MILPKGFGLSIPHQNAEYDKDIYDRVLAEFSPPWFYNHIRDLSHANYFRMLWRMSWAESKSAEVLATPDDGKIWFGGNEPHDIYQSNETPQEFYDGVCYWKDNIDRPLAIPGILWDQRGYDWWVEYQSLNPPNVDAYHIHIYAADGVDWTRQLNQALTIFNDKPLIITECGGWWVVPSLQIEIQAQVYTSIALGLIPSAAWFSLRYGPWKSYWRATDCWTINEKVTAVGRGYKKWSSRDYYRISLPFVTG